MDFDGIRAGAFDGEDELISYVAEAFREVLGSRTHRHLLILKHWQVAGYRLVWQLLTRQRVPFEYVQGLTQGMLLALHTYEDSKAGIKAFDEERATKLEEKARKLLNLATHAGTTSNEASAAAMGFAKLVANGEMTVFAKERAGHFLSDYHKMKQAYQFIMKNNPWMNLWGGKV